MHTLIKPTETKFLTGIIPTTWKELIFEYEKCWQIYVTTGTEPTEAEWENYRMKLFEEFGSNFITIFRHPEEPTVFDVYLRKDPQHVF